MLLRGLYFVVRGLFTMRKMVNDMQKAQQQYAQDAQQRAGSQAAERRAAPVGEYVDYEEINDEPADSSSVKGTQSSTQPTSTEEPNDDSTDDSTSRQISDAKFEEIQ